MGGTVAVTLRKPDASEFRMTRWTNSMPWGICNSKMFNSNEEHIDEYLEQWLSMKDDFEKNFKTGKFELDMTECYFPSSGLTPAGYGLVVVDHINHVILEMQGYTSFGSMSIAGIALGMDNVLDDSTYSIFQEFLAAGKIKGVTTHASFNEKRDYDELDTQDLNVWTKRIKNCCNPGSKDRIYQFIVDTAPFTIETFEEYTVEGLHKMHDRIIELGFVLTDDEEKYWTEIIADTKEEEEEYEEG